MLVVGFLPTILVGLTLGPLIDRLERRQADGRRRPRARGRLLRAAFVGGAGAIVALALVAGLATGFFRPAVYAGIPNLVPEAELAKANALLQTVENASWAVGPILGGLLTAATSPHAAYWINAVTFLVSAALDRAHPGAAAAERDGADARPLDRSEGRLPPRAQSRTLLAVLLAWGIAGLGSGASASARCSSRRTRSTPATSATACCSAASALGLVIGSFWSSAIRRALGLARAYGGAIAVMALGFGLGALAPNIWLAAGLLRRRRHRRRRRDRLQRAARPARGARRDARARADVLMSGTMPCRRSARCSPAR